MEVCKSSSKIKFRSVSIKSEPKSIVDVVPVKSLSKIARGTSVLEIIIASADCVTRDNATRVVANVAALRHVISFLRTLFLLCLVFFTIIESGSRLQ